MATQLENDVSSRLVHWLARLDCHGDVVFRDVTSSLGCHSDGREFRLITDDSDALWPPHVEDENNMADLFPNKTAC